MSVELDSVADMEKNSESKAAMLPVRKCAPLKVNCKGVVSMQSPS